MRRVTSRVAVLAMTVASLALVGCGQVNMLRAKQDVKDANGLYQSGNYQGAAEKYEEALAKDPTLADIYFFVGNSYDNLYKPARKGEAANDEFLTKAIENYKKSAEMNSTPNIKKLALEYLVAAYGPDKLNDPAQSEPIVQQMIQLEPTEPTNYFALAKIYEDNGDYENAEAQYLKAKEVKPDEPTVYTTLAGYYNRQGDFDKTIDALQQRTAKEPNNPEAHHMVATFYWDKVYRDFRLADADKKRFVQAGIEEVDKAIALKNDYVEAITYKNLLLRLQANLEKDRGRQVELLREADKLRDQALELRKKQQSGA
ncbi:MAG: tetratricopeptide repeat protein [Vicinamibacterales bacterium]